MRPAVSLEPPIVRLSSLLLLADLSPVGVKQLSGGDTSKGTWASKWVCQVCALDFQQKGSEFVPGE